MLTKVLSVKAIAPYLLDVRFNDGSGGRHDCAEMIKGGGPALVPLQDPAYFARVFLEFGAPTWPNSFDIDAEWLRREMAAAGELRPGIAAE
jgi:hypothetical protein